MILSLYNLLKKIVFSSYIWWVTTQEYKHHDATPPHIHGLPIWLSIYNFRSHKLWGTYSTWKNKASYYISTFKSESIGLKDIIRLKVRHHVIYVLPSLCITWLKVRHNVIYVLISLCITWIKVRHHVIYVLISLCITWLKVRHHVIYVLPSLCITWIKVRHHVIYVLISLCIRWFKVRHHVFQM
jgi:hypothetical protein